MDEFTFQQTKEYHELLDKYRDNNWFFVYKCKVCGFRGIGASVTLHPRSHGPMIREEANGR